VAWGLSSVWHERLFCKQEVTGSSPVGSTRGEMQEVGILPARADRDCRLNAGRRIPLVRPSGVPRTARRAREQPVS
jgi:hypothetical protein